MRTREMYIHVRINVFSYFKCVIKYNKSMLVLEPAVVIHFIRTEGSKKERFVHNVKIEKGIGEKGATVANSCRIGCIAFNYMEPVICCSMPNEGDGEQGNRSEVRGLCKIDEKLYDVIN